MKKHVMKILKMALEKKSINCDSIKHEALEENST